MWHRVRFKANFSDGWIYPKLLAYENDFESNKDYAIFTGDKINNGFKVGRPLKINIILGNIDKELNIARDITKIPQEGESGSPIININGEVIGILTGGITDISRVTEAIDNLE